MAGISYFSLFYFRMNQAGDTSFRFSAVSMTGKRLQSLLV
jgi:hypothetical protein